MGALLAPSVLRPRKNTACRLLRWCRAWNLCASMMWRIWNRNLTTLYAESLRRPCRAKAGFIRSVKHSGIARAIWRPEHGALLIADEIQCGLGRTGRHFAYQRFASKPDIAVIAKPLAAGLPLGAILASNEVAAQVSPGLHGTTFGGGPLICAVALEFLKILESERLLENVRGRGEELRAVCRSWQENLISSAKCARKD